MAQPKSSASSSASYSPAEVAAAQGILDGLQLRMDEQAWEIFNTWFLGKARMSVIFDSPAWGDYMRASSKLSDQINRRLLIEASNLRGDIDRAPHGFLTRDVAITMHAEVGSGSGGYFSGYNVLHGCNDSVGGFQISGKLSASRHGPPGSAYWVTFSQLKFVFNDRVDVNKRYGSDVLFARTCFNMARVLGVGPPLDYTLRIMWSAPEPVPIHIAAQLAGQGPAWLKTFHDR